MARAVTATFFLLAFVVASLADESPTKAADLFEPTDEWQNILPGQHIPAVSFYVHTRLF